MSKKLPLTKKEFAACLEVAAIVYVTPAVYHEALAKALGVKNAKEIDEDLLRGLDILYGNPVKAAGDNKYKEVLTNLKEESVSFALGYFKRSDVGSSLDAIKAAQKDDGRDRATDLALDEFVSELFRGSKANINPEDEESFKKFMKAKLMPEFEKCIEVNRMSRLSFAATLGGIAACVILVGAIAATAVLVGGIAIGAAAAAGSSVLTGAMGVAVVKEMAINNGKGLLSAMLARISPPEKGLGKKAASLIHSYEPFRGESNLKPPVIYTQQVVSQRSPNERQKTPNEMLSGRKLNDSSLNRKPNNRGLNR